MRGRKENDVPLPGGEWEGGSCWSLTHILMPISHSAGNKSNTQSSRTRLLNVSWPLLVLESPLALIQGFLVVMPEDIFSPLFKKHSLPTTKAALVQSTLFSQD